MSNRIVMCGCHETGWETVRYLLQQGVEFAHFVTISEEKARKLNVSGYRSFLDLAEAHDIPVYIAEKYTLNSDADRAFFAKEKFDLLIQGGWQRLFPEHVLNNLRVGAVGVHGSAEMLPKGRGRSPINWSLIEGQTQFILQFFLITEGVDDGDVFYHQTFDINAWDTCRTLYYKNALVSRQVLCDWIPKLLAGAAIGKPQVGEASYYPKRTPEDGRVSWAQSVMDLYNFVRAQTKPYPGAFSFLDGHKIQIWRAQPFDMRIRFPNAETGEIIECFDSGDVLVQCGDGLLLLTDYDRPEGAVLAAGKRFEVFTPTPRQAD